MGAPLTINAVVEFVTADPVTNVATTHRYAATSLTTLPTDTPADTPILSRIASKAITLSRSAFSGGNTAGASTAGAAEIELVNADGSLDFLAYRAANGRSVVYRIGVAGSAYPAAWTTVISGRLESIEVSRDKCVLRVKDRSADLQLAINANMYGGTNVLPNGVDGVPGDLKGRRKPYLLGRCFDIPAPCVNTSIHIYQVHDGAVSAISAAYDGGRALTFDADYANASALAAATVPSGKYATSIATGLLRLAQKPAGALSADCVRAASNKLSATIQTLLTQMGFASSDWLAADMTALDAATTAEVGHWVFDNSVIVDNGKTSGTTAASVIDILCKAAGCWWSFDGFARFRIQQLTAPSGTPVVSISAADMVMGSLESVASSDATKGIPAGCVNVDYAKCWQTQPTGVDVAITADRKSFVTQEYRRSSAIYTAIRAIWPNAPELTIQTPLAYEADATAERNRLASMYGVIRRTWTVTLRDPAAKFIPYIDIGSVVQVTYPRFGMSGGVLLRVIGLVLEAQRSRLTLTLWG